ncbi:MAG: MG2 domain-containing protein [Polyangiaceae bacterium]
MVRQHTSKLVPLGLLAATLLGTIPTVADNAETAARLDSLAKSIEGQLGSAGGKTMYLMTDKPLYHPGEAVWFRAWELSVKSLSGVSGEHGITFQLLDPRGGKVMEKRVLARAGMATNDFELPAGISGGGFTLRAISDLGTRQDRAITVAAYEAPRIKKTVDFLKTSYGPGDEVTAKVMIEAPTGGPLIGAKAVAIVTVDGAQIARTNVFPDDKGRAWVRFVLPAKIAKGDALLTIQVDGGGFIESIQRRIPIALEDVQLSFFPEGGDMVTGLPARVYLSARDPQGEPVEVEGQVFDDKGTYAGDFRSLHGGMARVSFTPQKDRSYSVKLKKPRGSAGKSFAFPAAKPSGCVLRAVDDYASQSSDVKVKVQCTDKQDVLVSAVLREKLVAKTAVTAVPGVPALVSLPVGKDAVGAVRVTAFDVQQRPMAERLVYRGLGSEMRVSVKADRASYSPREKVTLTIETKDAAGKPVAADVALAVVDDTVLKYADDKEGHILSQVYLLPEMPGQTVREPNFYFSKDRRAPEAMDLLLGTQGYRRFVWKWVGGQ